MPYRALAPHLHGAADAVLKYFIANHGIKNSNIVVEEGVDPNVEFAPTFTLTTDDKELICIEILENLYPPEIKDFVLGCKNHSVPAKLYCALLSEPEDQVETRAYQFATDNGIGLLGVDPANYGIRKINNNALSLSLGGLRTFKMGDYPSSYRAALQSAIDTFKNGNPGKGCLDVYQEIEHLTRRIGKRAASISGGLRSTASFNWDTQAWANIAEFLKTHLDTTVCKCPDLRPQLFNRIIGMTEYRNDVGHKPKTLAKRIERDRLAKTRFEGAMDELLILINASKPLRLKP